MSSKQRLEVWRGTRDKTSGGLRKSDLTRNKRGKVVSKKKSTQAASQNNLGSWLREKGKKVAKAEMLRKKSEPPSADKKVKSKAKAAPKVVPKKSGAPKAKPKVVAKPKPKPKPKPVVKKPRPKKKRAKAKSVEKINPLTNQPYDPNAKQKVSIDNISLEKKRKKGYVAPKVSAAAAAAINAGW